jgi:hypothetical protein
VHIVQVCRTGGFISTFLILYSPRNKVYLPALGGTPSTRAKNHP